MGTHSNTGTEFDYTRFGNANLDGLGVLERINVQTTMTRPKIIMLTAFGQEFLTHQAMLLGVDYFILKPFDLDILGKRILSLTHDLPAAAPNQFSATSPAVVTTVESGFNIVVEVTSMMHEIGIPAHVKGYQYIRDAILMVVEDVSLLGAVTSRVERGIRHRACMGAWTKKYAKTDFRIFYEY